HPARHAPAAGRDRGPLHLRGAADPRHGRADGDPPLRLRPRAGGGSRGRRGRRGARRHGRLEDGGGGDRDGGPEQGGRRRGGGAPPRPRHQLELRPGAWRGRRQRAAGRGVLTVKRRLLPWMGFLLLLEPAVAFARAGGGQSYSGGGHGGGGGGGDGGLIWLLIRLWFWLLFH